MARQFTTGGNVYWNDPLIITRSGTNPEAVLSMLRRHKQTYQDHAGEVQPTVGAVYQWHSRSKIPEHWRAVLVYCLLVDEKITVPELFRLGSAARSVARRPADPKQLEQELDA